MSTAIYKAKQIFTGKELLTDHAIVAKENIIQQIIPQHEVAANDHVFDYGEALIAPAFIDIQLYGAHNRLLSVYPDATTVEAIYTYCKIGGAAYSLPTVATSTYEVIFACIDAIKDYWHKGGKGIVGLHVEGPWINPAKRGAHKAEWIFSPTIDQAKQLLEYGKDVIKIITLAPEMCSKEVIELVQSYGVIVSAGHSNATYQQAMNAFDNGILAATHLYNAMSPLQHREPGLVGACFNHDKVMVSLVPDGYHVDFAAIQIAKRLMGERLFVITDAVTTTTEGYYQHALDGDKYTSNGILSGSALTLQKALVNLVQKVNIPLEEALRMCSTYPAQVLQLDNLYGHIAAGYKTSFVVLDEALQVKDVVED
jgi:N-acetylglucosamine-6-phosphate deacetylase